MPRPSHRTRSKKRRPLRLPGGRTEIHYKQKKTSVPQCARCGQALRGVPCLTVSKLHRLSASQRRVERIYSGQLCHNCLRESLKKVARSA